jgi:8-oxo-dGTP pyrophosphatase MutT (NUDIX family)
MKLFKQVGALCVCEADDGTPLVLLVTSRDTGRWVIPKGWPAKRLKPHEAAAREAMEEAGVSGKVGTKPIGSYQYVKKTDAGQKLSEVSVFLIAARAELGKWPEQAQRRRAWFSVTAAARRVSEPELRRLIRHIGQIEKHPKWRHAAALTASQPRHRNSSAPSRAVQHSGEAKDHTAQGAGGLAAVAITMRGSA